MLVQTLQHPPMCVCVILSGSAQQHTHKWDACFRASIFCTRALGSGLSEFSSKNEKISATLSITCSGSSSSSCGVSYSRYQRRTKHHVQRQKREGWKAKERRDPARGRHKFRQGGAGKGRGTWVRMRWLVAKLEVPGDESGRRKERQ